MPSPSVLVPFAIASFVLAVTPGPSVVLVVTVGTDRGRWAAVATALGLATGTMTWVVVVAAGLGTLVADRPGALAAVSAVGGLYLLALAGRRLLLDRDDESEQVVDTRLSGLVDGAMVNLLNPSLVLFLVALLPPFVDPDGPAEGLQIMVLGTVLAVVSTVVNIAWGLLGDLAGRRVRRLTGDRRATLIVAGVYAGLGLLALWNAVR